MKNIDMKIAVSAAAGIALFGVIMFAVRKAPDNAITKPLKTAASVAGTR